MTTPLSVRLPRQAERELSELASRHQDKTTAVIEAIHLAWKDLQEAKLEESYRAAVADAPHFPYESADERQALRERRNRREARVSE